MVKKEPKIIVSEARLAKIFRFSERKVRDYFKEARSAPGKYELLKCMDIYIDRSSGSDEKEALTKVQRETGEKKLAILNGEYVSQEEVSHLVSEMLFKFKNKFLSLHKKIRVALIGQEEKKYEDIILKHLLVVMNELKEFEELKQNGTGEEVDK